MNLITSENLNKCSIGHIAGDFEIVYGTVKGLRSCN